MRHGHNLSGVMVSLVVKVGSQQVMDHRMMTGSGKSKENLKSCIFYVNPKRLNQNTTISIFFVLFKDII